MANAPATLWNSLRLWPGKVRGREVHVWRIAVRQPDSLVDQWINDLPPEEQDVCRKFQRREDRVRAGLGRWWRRRILARILDLPPGELVFSATPEGKPFLLRPASPRKIHFNVSHSGDWVLIGVSEGGRVGIDVEIHGKIDFQGLAESCFSAAEIKAWFARPLVEQKTVFFDIWARKEAYLKAIGSGLSKPLKDFSVPAAEAPGPLFIVAPAGGIGDRWTLWPLAVDSRHSAALVAEGSPSAIKLWDAEPSALGSI